MTGIKVRGIVLKASDYKDDDKLIRLYTLEQGKIGAVMRGVKKANAKLKIAAQVFCFGEYILSGRGSLPTVAGCTVGESFFSLSSDPDKFAAAASVMEIADRALPDAESNPQVFIQTLKTMKEFLKAKEPREIRTILLNFMLEFLKLSGYGLKLEKCCVCGGINLRERRFDFSSGGIVCRPCAAYDAVKISPLCNAVMLAVQRCETERLNTLNMDINGIEEALSLCVQTMERVFEISLKSF
jgi:DNA repair protein RecO (recombination protein O)